MAFHCWTGIGGRERDRKREGDMDGTRTGDRNNGLNKEDAAFNDEHYRRGHSASYPGS